MRPNKRIFPLLTPSLILLLTISFSSASLLAQTQETQTGNLLDTVIVSASRALETLRDLPSSPVVIGEAEINRHPNADLSDILEDAGIMVDRQYYLGGQVVIRGLQGNIAGTDVQSDIIMLLNGHRIGTSAMLRFPAKNIERVEILRGPAGLQFGSAAMGGVVNVITKRGSGPLQAHALTGFGSWGHYDLEAGLSGEHKGFDYSAGIYKMSQTSDYHVGGGDRYLNTRTGHRIEGSAQLGYTFNERHRIGVIANYLDLHDYGNVGSFKNMNDSNPMTGQSNTGNKTEGTNKFIDLSYEGADQTERFTWLVKYFRGWDEQTGTGGNVPYEDDLQGAQARLTGNFENIGLTVTAGYDWTEYDYFATSSTLGPYKYTDMGGYLLGKLKALNDRLTITGGARVSYIDTDSPDKGGKEYNNTKITPALGFSYLATDWLKLRANYSSGYRAPTLTELFGEGQTMVGRNFFMLGANTRVNNVWLLPNPDLKPQFSNSFEIGIDMDLPELTASVTAFYSKLMDKIEREDTPYPAFNYAAAMASDIYPCLATSTSPAAVSGYQSTMFANKNVGFPSPVNTYMGSFCMPSAAHASYENHGDANMGGFEWSIRWDAGKTFGWDISVGPYSHGTWIPLAEYTSGIEENQRMRKVPKLYTSYGLFVETLDETFWLDLNLISKTKQRSTYLSADPDIPDYQDGFTIANIRIGKTLYEWENETSLALQTEVSNIFDKYYEIYPSYPLPGRTFYVALRFDYK
jgi:vitamin B12 transporter